MTTIEDCLLARLPHFEDRRGILTYTEHDKFERVFWVTNPSGKRGNHAHKTCEHCLICVSGSCVVTVDDGKDKYDFVLNNPQQALYVPAMIWDSEHSFGVGTILIVLASHKYDEADYIRDYQEFLRLKNAD